MSARELAVKKNMELRAPYNAENWPIGKSILSRLVVKSIAPNDDELMMVIQVAGAK